MGCVCLACKIEEAQPARRVRDVINVFTHIKQVRQGKPIKPVILDGDYIRTKNDVIKAERRVLKDLGFCVHIKHPHKLIVMYMQFLGFQADEKFVQMSWNFMNDSLRTDCFVRYQPETIACACIYLSARKLAIPLPRHPAWLVFVLALSNLYLFSIQGTRSLALSRMTSRSAATESSACTSGPSRSRTSWRRSARP